MQSGFHVSVPTLVGETYQQRQLIQEAASKDAEIRAAAKKLMAKLREKGVDIAIIDEFKKENKSIESAPQQLTNLQMFARKYLPTDEAR
jgi:hypothetical protein